jgi:cell division initiation protein
MTTTDSTPSGARRRAARLTPDTVRRWQFTRTPLGRRGYLEAEVDRFQQLVIDEIAYADAEKAELRAELNRLRNYFREQRIDPAPGRTNGSGAGRAGREVGVNVQAVNMMSMAQQAADEHIAQAEVYARQLVGDARRQYEEILQTAHRQAEEAARQAAAAEERTATSDRPADSAELRARIAYLRTFADVTQVQVASILQALGHELERLTTYGGEEAQDTAERLSVRAPAEPVV